MPERGRWRRETRTGTAAELHADAPDTEGGPVLRRCIPTDRSVALGSAQTDDVLDPAALAGAGLVPVRRRSGGGAVLLEPGEVLWVDLAIGRDDPLWDDDVGRAAWWVGEAWAAALAPLLPPGAPAPSVHRGGLVRAPWSDLVCFAGTGAGEVTLGPGGPKLVGISQRRTRAGARFQCAAPLRWRPERLIDVLRLTPASRAAALAEVAPRAVALEHLGVRDRGSALVGALFSSLP